MNKKIDIELYKTVWKEYFIRGCNYKYICLKTNLSFFQFKSICKKLSCYNYSLVNNHFQKDFKIKYKIDLYNRSKFYGRGKRENYQFASFDDEQDVIKRRKNILKKFNEVLKTEKKITEGIKNDLQEGLLYQKEIAQKYRVSEYFVLSCKTQRKKRVSKPLPDIKKKKVLEFLNSWFAGRVITRKMKEDLKALKLLELVQAGKIKEAKQKIELI